MKTPSFTKDWFTMKTGAWLEHVVPRLRDVQDARWVEIGCYQGLSALWTLENVLRQPGSLIYCIDIFDPFQPGFETWGDPSTNYVEVFDAKVGCRHDVVKLVGHSHDVLPVLRGTRFHGAYIDGDHREYIVREDLRLLWPLLLPGSVCVFDDYEWNRDPGVKIVIDDFLKNPENGARLLFHDFQAIVLKEK